ncbi:helix-turn-helix transcriptional regulator [Hymenobacter monticola]|uniref:helix-turn-helix transcriptional regulator n=1 Tax=Hymenobacter monticola TaxID=1705399 RepID=UPI003627B6E3
MTAKFWELTGHKLSPRQFSQDLADMREGGSTGYNAPIAHTRDRGYHYTDDNFRLHNSPLETGDAAVLRQALAALRQFQGLGLSDELGDVVQRVEAHLQAQPADDAAGQSVIWFEQVPDYAGTPFLGPLYQAIRARQVLLLRYRAFGAAEAWEETVQPYLLKQYNHRWFLVGQGSGRSGISNYALDRIEGVAADETISYQPPRADLAARFADVVGVSVPEGGVLETVRLRFRAGRGQYVLTKPLHPSQQTDTITGDVVEISLQLVLNPELQTLLLSFGDDIEVLAPLSLRTRISERLKAATGLYRQ